MKNLSEKKYWDSIYDKISGGQSNNKSFKNKLKNITRDYSNYLIWESILPKILPRGDNYKIIEVGCAPGKYLLRFSQEYGYEPYGVEYSEKGSEITRINFIKEGKKPENIILADFFNKEFQDKNFEKYDVVFSRGFIEHYDDVKSVVKLHTNLVRSGGFVVVMIPNLNGLNRFLAKFLNQDSYDLHNVSIMDKKIYADLFSSNNLKEIYCDYVGVFSVGLFNTNSRIKYWIYRALLVLQRPFDFMLRVIFPKGGFRSKYSSPYLLFVGQKNININ